jgi:hypothetical protein
MDEKYPQVLYGMAAQGNPPSKASSANLLFLRDKYGYSIDRLRQSKKISKSTRQTSLY